MLFMESPVRKLEYYNFMKQSVGMRQDFTGSKQTTNQSHVKNVSVLFHETLTIRGEAWLLNVRIAEVKGS